MTLVLGLILLLGSQASYGQDVAIPSQGQENPAGANQASQVTQISQEDEVLRLYRVIVDILDETVLELADRPERSSERLQLAEDTFNRLLQTQVISSGIVQGVRQTFERSKEAVINRSLTDLIIQNAVIKGGLQRLVYESALGEASQHQELARGRFAQLVEDMKLSEERNTQLMAGLDKGIWQPVIDVAIAEQMTLELDKAKELLANKQYENTYAALAKVYSSYIPIQDSPSLTADAGTALIDTIGSVVAKQDNAAQKLDAFIGLIAAFKEQAETSLVEQEVRLEIAAEAALVQNVQTVQANDSIQGQPNNSAITPTTPPASDTVLDTVLDTVSDTSAASHGADSASNTSAVGSAAGSAARSVEGQAINLPLAPLGSNPVSVAPAGNSANAPLPGEANNPANTTEAVTVLSPHEVTSNSPNNSPNNSLSNSQGDLQNNPSMISPGNSVGQADSGSSTSLPAVPGLGALGF
ncbi:MAG: hypothetical protein R2880_10355 [Deinococcales bacterium]